MRTDHSRMRATSTTRDDVASRSAKSWRASRASRKSIDIRQGRSVVVASVPTYRTAESQRQSERIGGDNQRRRTLAIGDFRVGSLARVGTDRIGSDRAISLSIQRHSSPRSIRIAIVPLPSILAVGEARVTVSGRERRRRRSRSSPCGGAQLNDRFMVTADRCTSLRIWPGWPG